MVQGQGGIDAMQSRRFLSAGAAIAFLSLACSEQDTKPDAPAREVGDELQEGSGSTPTPVPPGGPTEPAAMPVEATAEQANQVPQPCAEIVCDGGLTPLELPEGSDGGASGLCICARVKSAR